MRGEPPLSGAVKPIVIEVKEAVVLVGASG